MKLPGLREAVGGALERRGWRKQDGLEHAGMEPEFLELYGRCAEFTMTSVERMYALYKATEHVVKAGVPGDLVECGVWRGGSSMLSALALQRLGDEERTIYLYDTFEGMSEPDERDVSFRGDVATGKWQRLKVGEVNEWCYSPLEEVEANMLSTGIDRDRLRFVKGKVEDTLPATMPERISLLRLDTDWYESTYHELRHLFPLLSTGGVLIVDDYGHWEGAREATDRYLAEVDAPILLNRVDYTGRVGVRVS
jgi:O-methyltransferase